MKYLNPSDLMVCDYVFRAGYGIAEVFEVCATSVRVQLVSDGKIMTWSKLIEPIPITAEILEKNGFKDIGDDTYQLTDRPYWFWVDFYNHKYGCEYDTSTYDYDVSEQRLLLYGDPFVHELQHSLRICGLKDVANNFNL